MNLQTIRRRVEQLTPPPPPPARLVVFGRCALSDDRVTGIEAYGYETKRLIDESLDDMETRLLGIMPTDSPWIVGNYLYANDEPPYDEVVRSYGLHKRS